MMNFFSKKTEHMSVRRYDAAQHNNFTADWKLSTNQSADEVLRYSIKTIIERSRDLARNNDYVRWALRLLKSNVVGHAGIKLQLRVKKRNGSINQVLNNQIEKHWKDWANKQYCDVSGHYSLIEFQKAFLVNRVRDGEAIVRIVRNFNNPYRIALQLIENDYLDYDLNTTLSNGNSIIMGVERDEWLRPVNYHFIDFRGGTISKTAGVARKHFVLPASDIIHSYRRDRPTQTRGVPRYVSSVTRLRQLGSYEDATLISARAESGKMGFFVSEGDNRYGGDDIDSDGNLISEASPGTFEQLPAGVKFQAWEPQNPNANMPDFVRSMQRGAACGMEMSYNLFANDRENVNYSSIRDGALIDRDLFREDQQTLIEDLLFPVYLEWLKMQDLTGFFPTTLSSFEREQVDNPTWNTRGWAWIDPQREVNASISAIDAKLKSRTRIIAEGGDDFHDTIDELTMEKDYIEESGLNPSLVEEEEPEEEKPEEDEEKENED